MRERPGLTFAAALIVISIAAYLLWLKFGGSWTIDRCLDSGGTWDYAASICRH